MSSYGASGPVDGGLDLWRAACQKVLSEAGRARLHDIRAALNSVAVSAEVLHMTSVTPEATPPVAAQMLNTIRHDLALAAGELSSLESLVTQTASPTSLRWPQAVEWAFSMVDPVARRRQIVLVPPAGVPPVETDTRAGVCLALTLVEAVTAGVGGSQCVMRSVPEPSCLVLEWIAPNDASSDTLATRLLAAVFGPQARWSHEGDHRRLDLAIATHV